MCRIRITAVIAFGLHLYRSLQDKNPGHKIKNHCCHSRLENLTHLLSKQRNHLASLRLGSTPLPDRVPSPKDFFKIVKRKPNSTETYETRFNSSSKKLLRSLHLQFLMRKAGYHSYRGIGHGGSDGCRSRKQKPMSSHSNPFGHHRSVSVWNHQFR